MGSSILEVLKTGFWICLVSAIVFFLISVALFFVFDIKTIFSIKTGRAQAKAVKEMKAANASTGRLRVNGVTQTSKLTEKEKKTGRAPVIIPPKEEEKKSYYQSDEQTDKTTVLNTENENTQLLSANTPTAPGTPDYAETSVLSQETTEDFTSGYSSDDKKVDFKVVKKELYIHTQEMIS